MSLQLPRFLVQTSLILGLAATAGAQVCDLTEIASSAAPGTPGRTVVVGETAYFAAGAAGVVAVDIGEPGQFGSIVASPTTGAAADVALEYFRDLILVAEGAAGVGTYAIAAAGALNPVATVDVGGTAVTIDGLTGTYTVGTVEGELLTVRVDSSGMGAVAGRLTLGGQVVDLARTGNTVYCGLGTAGQIAVVDVQDATSPALLGTASVGGAVQAVAVSGSTVFAAVDGLGIVSLSAAGGVLTPQDTLPLVAPATHLEAWSGRVFAGGPELGVIEIEAAIGTDLLEMARIELDGTRAFAVVGDSLYVGREALGLSIVDISDCAVTGGSVVTSFIPAGARAAGASASFWVTDVAIANLSDGPATFNVAYLPKGVDNSDPVNVTEIVAAGQQLIAADVFGSMFGLTSANGGLRVTVSHPEVRITSRTYNAAGSEGTYGQYIPALKLADAVEHGKAGALLQLQENADFRTNIGLVNIDPTPVDFKIALYDGANGSLRAEVVGSLPAYGQNQYNGIYALAGAGQVTSGFAVVTIASSTGRLLAYASVVDRGSNDPIFVPTQRLGEASPFNP